MVEKVFHVEVRSQYSFLLRSHYLASDFCHLLWFIINLLWWENSSFIVATTFSESSAELFIKGVNFSCWFELTIIKFIGLVSQLDSAVKIMNFIVAWIYCNRHEKRLMWFGLVTVWFQNNNDGIEFINIIIIIALSYSQTNYIVDWLVESESRFLGHVIGIICVNNVSINNVYSTVT